MALKNKIELNTGIYAEYWKINEISISYIDNHNYLINNYDLINVINIKIDCYLDQNSRLHNKDYIISDNYSFKISNDEFFNLKTNDYREFAYNKLKEIDKFKESQDI